MSAPRPGLHQRSSKLNVKADAAADISETEKHPEPTQSTLRPAKNGPVFEGKWLLLAFAVASALAIYSNPSIVSQLLPKTGGKYDKGSFAVCSQEGSKVYTVDNQNTRTDCIIVHGQVIAGLGILDDIKKENVPIRLMSPGSILVPGLSDSHGHVLEYGAAKLLALEGTKDVQETVTRVRNYIMKNPEIFSDKEKFVLGGGWDHTSWPSTGWPSAADLEADPIIRGRPVVLQSKDCHALWISQKVLDASLPFPDAVEGGIIVRDASGDPTGMLLDGAQDLVKQPDLTEDDLLKRFQILVRDAIANGLTSVHDAGLDPASLQFFRKQAELKPLPIRLYGMKFFDELGEYWGNTTAKLDDMLGSRLSARSVKIFADGALRTGGAALYEPYTDNPTTNGFMRIGPEVLHEIIPLFLRDGWQVNVHGIGDRANGAIIDAFESTLQGVNVTALRPRLEHAQMMNIKDIKHLGGLGVIASVQPTHATDDMWYAEERLGPERIKDLYPFRTIIDSGARVTLGSDFPVETLNPIAGFYAAITRLSFDGKSPHGADGWFPEQRLTREEALRGITIDPAYASFTENDLGSLEIGKRADFVLLSQDIMTAPVEDLMATKVLATVLDGEVIFGSI